MENVLYVFINNNHDNESSQRFYSVRLNNLPMLPYKEQLTQQRQITF